MKHSTDLNAAFSNQYHSQIGQDKYLEEEIFRGQRNGFFVEIGAVDGLHFSNTLFFERHRDWFGICIEPNPIEYRKLLSSGRNCIMENVAISSREGTRPFLSIDGWGKGLSGLLDKYDQRHIERIERETKDKNSKLEIINVNTSPLSQILSKHKISFVDYCSIDCEGSEMEIIESIDFSKVHIKCMTIENNYGLEKETRYLKDKGYIHHKKIRWDDVFIHNEDLLKILPHKRIWQNFSNIETSEPIANTKITFQMHRDEAVKYLNPHFTSLFKIPENIEGIQVAATELITHKRFDIAAKFLYAKNKINGISLKWAEDVYDEHIRVFNGYEERDGSGKKGKEGFRNSFNETIDSITATGFNSSVSVIPITKDGHAIDGSHRIAACAALNKEITALKFEHPGWRYDAEYFLRKGLSRTSADACIHACCKLKNSLRLALIFPAAAGRDTEVENILKRHGKIWYKKHVSLRGKGPTFFMAQVYSGENWLGTWENGYSGARSKAQKCFAIPGPMRAYVFEPDSENSMIAAKQQIRELYRIDKHSIHINDTHEETIRLSGVILNENSIDLLNKSSFIAFNNFNNLFTKFKEKLIENPNLDSDDFCISGSATLSLYGIRDCNDFDYLTMIHNDPLQEKPYISKHDSQKDFYPTDFADIIYNPNNHLYFNGIKFANLPLVVEMKQRRLEDKDILDIRRTKDITTDFIRTNSVCAKNDGEIFDNIKPEFTLIMANYNNALYLEESINSVLYQTFSNWKLIIIDDCSTDDSLNIISKFLNDERIQLIQHEQNMGYVESLRSGIKHCDSKYFGIIDADDALFPNAVEVMLQKHKDNPNHGYIHSQFVYCDSKLIPQKYGYCAKIKHGKTNIDSDCVSHFKTFKLNFYLKTTGFDSDIMFAEDKDISYKMEEVSKILFVDQDLYLYRVRPISESNHPRKRKISHLTMLKAKCNALIRRAEFCLKNDTSFLHLLKSFEFFKNEDHAFASKELEMFSNKFDIDSLPKIDNRPEQHCDVSFVVVTYNSNKQILECIFSILNQQENQYDIIIVDNGGNDDILPELIKQPILYVRSPINIFPSLARNIGAYLSNSPIVCFIDDDAVITSSYVRSVRQAFSSFEIIGMRGRITPKSPSKMELCPTIYDPGNIITPTSFPIEGNIAVKREAYLELGGMDPFLFGGEGLDLSYRITIKHGPGSIIYWPDCLVHHDPSDEIKSEFKKLRYERMHRYLKLKNPEIWEYYHKFEIIDTANSSLSKFQQFLNKKSEH